MAIFIKLSNWLASMPQLGRYEKVNFPPDWSPGGNPGTRLDMPKAVAECGRALKTENPARHFIIPLLIAIALYAISYSWIEHRRHMNGPWVLAFTNSLKGAPVLLINQPKVGVTNVQLVFPGAQVPATNSSGTIAFENPREVPFDVPFGKCIFMDATFLPGTLTFRFFGHEIELLPRVLMIDHQEHPWRTGEVITLPEPSGPGPLS